MLLVQSQHHICHSSPMVSISDYEAKGLRFVSDSGAKFFWSNDAAFYQNSFISCYCYYCMQHLCRQGRSAVQVTYDLDIFAVDCLDRACAGDVTRDGAVNHVDVKTRVTGRLHLRLANIGQMSDLKSSKLSKFSCFVLMHCFLQFFFRL